MRSAQSRPGHVSVAVRLIAGRLSAIAAIKSRLIPLGVPGPVMPSLRRLHSPILLSPP